MKAVFADTSFYLAILNPRDVWHSQAVHLSQELQCVTVVTDYILVEVGNALSRSGTRRLFIDLLPHLRADRNTVIVPISPSLFDSGYDLYARRPDKDWSLTDCVSFVVVEQERLAEALTADHHFEQAGFTILLK